MWNVAYCRVRQLVAVGSLACNVVSVIWLAIDNKNQIAVHVSIGWGCYRFSITKKAPTLSMSGGRGVFRLNNEEAQINQILTDLAAWYWMLKMPCQKELSIKLTDRIRGWKVPRRKMSRWLGRLSVYEFSSLAPYSVESKDFEVDLTVALCKWINNGHCIAFFVSYCESIRGLA